MKKSTYQTTENFLAKAEEERRKKIKIYSVLIGWADHGREWNSLDEEAAFTNKKEAVKFGNSLFKEWYDPTNTKQDVIVQVRYDIYVWDDSTSGFKWADDYDSILEKRGGSK